MRVFHLSFLIALIASPAFALAQVVDNNHVTVTHTRNGNNTFTGINQKETGGFVENDANVTDPHIADHFQVTKNGDVILGGSLERDGGGNQTNVNKGGDGGAAGN